jgi:hypothetical protein
MRVPRATRAMRGWGETLGGSNGTLPENAWLVKRGPARHRGRCDPRRRSSPRGDPLWGLRYDRVVSLKLEERIVDLKASTTKSVHIMIGTAGCSYDTSDMATHPRISEETPLCRRALYARFPRRSEPRGWLRCGARGTATCWPSISCGGVPRDTPQRPSPTSSFCSRSGVYPTVRAYRAGTLGLEPDNDGQLSPPLRTTVLVPTLPGNS